jgi:pyrroloquinoline-quinone synthase
MQRVIDSPTRTDSFDALMRLVGTVLAEVDHRQNPYFMALNDGSFGREDFIETQIQFQAAVVFFSRPMAALAAKIPDPSLRVEILRNVWEEHGEGHPGRMHGTTFVAFLSRLLGCSLQDAERAVASRPLWPEVRAFNTVLAGACVLDEYLVGAGVMGIIERMFADISSAIGRGCVQRGFLKAEQMVHYDLHEKVDVRHAADFFEVLAASWDGSERHRYDIEQGLRMGAVVFDQLYASLYRARTRRWQR